MAKIVTVFIIIFICLSTQAEEADTIYIPPIDTLQTVTDSLILPDSLSDAERAQKSFEQRKKQFEKEEQKKRLPYLSFEDSLNIYFLPERLNLRKYIDRSTYKDAGDYFKHDPSFFVLDHQVTPMRKTVQPFGLSGNRLNIIHNGMVLNPFEHIVEPDGLVDMNDIPTALDENIFILPSGSGQIFGGTQSIATLVTTPKRPDSNDPQTAILVNKGSFDYSNVRGRYNKHFLNGKKISASVGYRKATGETSFRDDDSYQYTLNTTLPMGEHYAVKAFGQTYNRKASLVIQPDLQFDRLARNRIERSGTIQLEKMNPTHTSKTHFAYSYLRQNSNIDVAYIGRFDINEYGLTIGREWFKKDYMLKTDISTTQSHYRNILKRNSGKFTTRFIKFNNPTKLALTAGGEYVDGYRFLPFASLLILKDSPYFFYMFSAGYSERAPSLHELNLSYQEQPLYPDNSIFYADRGNPDLSSEKQLTGNITLELGSLNNNIRFSATAGKIKDGIDWENIIVTDATLPDRKLFVPRNGDITFADIKLTGDVKINDFISWYSGGAYHHIEYENFENKAYQPDYQLFSGMELHLYWAQKYTDLFAYAEISYYGKYSGYDQSLLGEEPIVNAKLSFKIKDFRFNYIWQNPLQIFIQPREKFTTFGRITYYSFEWNFFN